MVQGALYLCPFHLWVSKTLNTQAQSCAFSIQILRRPVNVDVYLFYLVDRVEIGLAHRASKVVAFIYSPVICLPPKPYL